MEKDWDIYRIQGGRPLYGEYQVKGAKNAALPIMAASLCRGGIHEIYGCPRIGDVEAMIRILESLGAGCRWEDDCLTVDSRFLSETAVPKDLMSRLRSSVFLMGSLLARTGEAVIYRPGGCRIGSRPIDIHMEGLRQLGYTVTEDGEKISCRGVCRGGRVQLPFPSVGATENLMMAALSGDGLTILENCAAEPEIEDLQGFLRNCGFRVYGGGTPVITVEGCGMYSGSSKSAGRKENCGTMYFIMEDRIEAATYMMALAGSGGEGILRGGRTEHLEAVIKILEKMGTVFRHEDGLLEVRGPKKLKSPGMVKTGPYPGFPTDCQPQLTVLAACAQGQTTIREEIFENRFTHKKALMKMGANIETCGKNAIIKGSGVLCGNRVQALDLRGGAALVLAGLLAEGTTTVTDIYHIERGYQDFHEGIRQLGGKIEKQKERTAEEAGKSADETDHIPFYRRWLSGLPGLTDV